MYSKTIATFKAFAEGYFHDFSQQYLAQLKNEVESQSKDYILQVDEEEYKSFLQNKYTLEPLTVDYTNIQTLHPLKEKKIFRGHFNEEYEKEVYNISIEFPFTGSPILFKYAPMSRVMTSYPITVDSNRNVVIAQFTVYNMEKSEYEGGKNTVISRAFPNIGNLNKEVESWNNQLPGYIKSTFDFHKQKLLKENKFFEDINVKVNKDTTGIFTVPTIKKKIIPQPAVSDKKHFSSEPAMSMEMYNDTLKTIYQTGKAMEKKPMLYQGKDEEALRDHFLAFLETRYDGTTATAETFNKGGKTDILLKYQDGTNLFVSECKFWHGASEFHKAINQLFDRYLTWRDSKTALLLFVSNAEFTSVLKTIQEEAVKHPYFVKVAGNRGDSSFSYEFHLPGDKGKKIYFEIIAFHFKK